MEAKERLYITADKKRLVKEGDPKGAFLYAAPGDTVPDSAAAMFGLVNGALAADGDPATVMASDVVQEAYMGRDLADV